MLLVVLMWMPARRELDDMFSKLKCPEFVEIFFSKRKGKHDAIRHYSSNVDKHKN
jgi:hypothetical protein